MRIQKLLLIVSVAGLSTFLAVAQSSDSEAQEKALKALRDKMKELDTAKPATPAPVSKSPPPQKAAPPVATKRVEAVAPTAVVSSDADAQAKAIEALRQKQAELDAQQKGATGVVANSPDADAQAKAQAAASEALRVKQQELDAQRPAAEATRQAKEQSNTKKSISAVAVAAPAPMARPTPAAAVGLTADQLVGSSSLSRREKLDALLSLYLADTITPREYHQHRAAIVAQP